MSYENEEKTNALLIAIADICGKKLSANEAAIIYERAQEESRAHYDFLRKDDERRAWKG